MSVEHIEVLVEEPSMEAALRVLLPRIVGGVSHQVYPHQSKYALLQRLPNRLRAYATWLPDTWRIVILLDRDDDDCVELKARLEEISAEAGLTTRSVRAVDWQLANRVVIEELEAWYFGDWEAVRQAYPRVGLNVPHKAKYREPDEVSGGTWEAFERLLQQAGYFKTGLRKVEAARAIAAHMDPARNRSPSFNLLRRTLEEVAS